MEAFSEVTNIFILAPFVFNLAAFQVAAFVPITEACLVTLGTSFLKATLTVSGYLVTKVIGDNNAGDETDTDNRSNYNASFD